MEGILPHGKIRTFSFHKVKPSEIEKSRFYWLTIKSIFLLVQNLKPLVFYITDLQILVIRGFASVGTTVNNECQASWIRSQPFPQILVCRALLLKIGEGQLLKNHGNRDDPNCWTVNPIHHVNGTFLCPDVSGSNNECHVMCECHQTNDKDLYVSCIN